MLFTHILWLHVVSAVVALGSNLTYFPWLSGAKRKAGSLVFTLRGVKKLDDWMANPAEGFAWTAPWILTEIVGGSLVALTLAITFLMAVKPSLW